MTSPSKDAWNHAYEWRKKAARERKVARIDLDFLLSSDRSTLPLALVERLQAIKDILKNPDAPQILSDIFEKFDVDVKDATRHLANKYKHKDTSKKARRKLMQRWHDWMLTWHLLLNVRRGLRNALEFDAASKTMMELSDAFRDTKLK